MGLFGEHKDGVMQDFIEGPFEQTLKTANFPILACGVCASKSEIVRHDAAALFTKESTEEIPPVIPPTTLSVYERMQKILAFLTNME